jgi:hypothetical protein
LNVKVPPWFYRLLWITIAVIGAICALGLIPLLIDDESVTIISGRWVIIVGGIFGAVMLVYALWRLLWPLKAPPRN